jgi:hypothetical protein
MTLNYRSALLIASLAMLPATGAFAQSGPNLDARIHTNGAVSNSDYPPGQPSDPALSPGYLSKSAKGSVPAAQNPNVPGATGMTIVHGDNSTIGQDRTSSVEEKIGATTDGGNGSGN